MREYEHIIIKPFGIVFPDKRSAKARWGLNQPEYLDEDSPHFLRKGHTTFPHSTVVYQLTEPSEPIGQYNDGKDFGGDTIIVEEEQYAGWFSESGIHKSKIVWD